MKTKVTIVKDEFVLPNTFNVIAINIETQEAVTIAKFLRLIHAQEFVDAVQENTIKDLMNWIAAEVLNHKE